MQQQRIIVRHYGGPEELQLVEEERPEPKPGEVRVRVLSAGVALPDVMMREGTHPLLGKGGITGKIVLVRNAS